MEVKETKGRRRGGITAMEMKCSSASFRARHRVIRRRSLVSERVDVQLAMRRIGLIVLKWKMR